MNAMSFALNGNIALSCVPPPTLSSRARSLTTPRTPVDAALRMEIGSAYALQVCLLQIPAMVAFSAIYDPSKMGEYVDTFT